MKPKYIKQYYQTEADILAAMHRQQEEVKDDPRYKLVYTHKKEVKK